LVFVASPKIAGFSCRSAIDSPFTQHEGHEWVHMFVEVELHAAVGIGVKREGGCSVSSTLGIQRGVGGCFPVDLVPVVVVVGERIVDGSQRELGECLEEFLRRDTLTKYIFNYAMNREAGSCDVWTAATDRRGGGDMGMQHFRHHDISETRQNETTLDA
jgi:hypothetical protein